MTLFFLIGLIFIALILFFRSSLFHLVRENSRFVRSLQNAKWFQNVWLAGLFLFLINTILFGFTGLVLYILTLFTFPYIHFIVMIFAVVVSILFWMVVNKACRENRLKIAAIGSSFYLLLTLIILYFYVNIEPFYPGEDTFMRALGLSLAMMVTFVAWISCFVITGLTNKTQV